MRHIRTKQPIKKSLTVRSIGAAALLVAALLLLAGCGNMVGGLETEQATGSITPRITSSAVSASKIDSYTVTVSGPDIETYTQTFSGGSSRLEIAVTPGERTFTVSGEISDPNSFVTEITGDSSVQVSANETTNASVSLNTVTDSRILFADGGNNRIVMFDDMQGNGWKELYPTTEDTPIIQNPHDVDYDSRGRIYVACDNGLFRFDNMEGKNLTPLVAGGDPIVSLSVDRSDGWVYFLDTNKEIFRGPVVESGDWGGTATSVDIIPGASSVAAFPGGSLLVGGEDDLRLLTDPPNTTSTNYLGTLVGDVQDFKVTPSGLAAIVDDTDLSGTLTPEGSPVFYLLDAGAPFSAKASFGSIDGNESRNRGEFFGAVRFGASAKSGYYVADRTYLLDIDEHRVIHFDDSSGAGWQTFGQWDSDNTTETDGEEDGDADPDKGQFLFHEPIVGFSLGA